MIRKFRLFWGMAAPPAGSAAAGNLRIDLDYSFGTRNPVPGLCDTHDKRRSAPDTPGAGRGRLGLRSDSPAHHLEDHRAALDALAGRRLDLGSRALATHFFGSPCARQRRQRGACRLDMDLLAGGKDSRSRGHRRDADSANRAHETGSKKVGWRVFVRHALISTPLLWAFFWRGRCGNDEKALNRDGHSIQEFPRCRTVQMSDPRSDKSRRFEIDRVHRNGRVTAFPPIRVVCNATTFLASIIRANLPVPRIF